MEATFTAFAKFGDSKATGKFITPSDRHTLQVDKIPVVSRNGWFIHGRNYSLQPSLKILVFFRNFGFNDNLIKKLRRIS